MQQSVSQSPVTLCCEAIECSSPGDFEPMVKILHCFRNKCSKILAELLVRELRNSQYVKDELTKDREGTLSKTLFQLLKSVSSKGKKVAQKKDKCTPDDPSSKKTQHLNNLKDKHNEAVLSSISLSKLLLEEGKAEDAVKDLSGLDSAFLLWILTNDILQFPHNPEVQEALDTVKDIRNSILHGDSYKNSKRSISELLPKLCTKGEVLCKYLGIDTSFQNYTSHTQRSFNPVFREVQQEIHISYCHKAFPEHFNQHQNVQPTIKHIRGYSQPDEIVEDLVKFLANKVVREHEEPRPVLLCGPSGAGKSSVLHRLLHTVICEEQFSDGSFSLVVVVDEEDTKNRTKKQFWECLFNRLTKRCPNALKKYPLEDVEGLLKSNCNKNILLLVDQNLQDTRKLNSLMPLMDHGMWVLTYLGVPEPSAFYHVLQLDPLSEGQVHQMLCDITPEEQCSQMSHLYRMCDYKGIIDTPDMVCIFAKVCLEIRGCMPFYRLIQSYIRKKMAATDEDKRDENERDLISLGKEALNVIRLNKKHYPVKSLAGIENSVCRLFLERDRSKGYFFKYRAVEDYLAAEYVVKQPEVACEGWLPQATLFKRVFEITCALWQEQENGICTNLHYIRKYLEKLFEVVPSKKKGKKKRGEPMETDKTDVDDATPQNNFVRWKFLSTLAENHQNNEDILLLLAELLARKRSWSFKCRLVTDKCLDNLSLVFRHIKLTKELIIKLESGPSVAMLLKLWDTLSRHEGVCSNTSVQLVIHHTESNWIMHEKLLALLPATLVQTTEPLYISKFVGPLLCSRTEQFLKCLCMKKLDVLDVHVYDVGSLREVLANQQKLRSVIVRLNLRVEEMKIPNTLIKLSSSFPLNLTITYFEGLQTLLDRIEPPRRLSSLRIYRVYIHENFRLDLSRFTRLKFLSIRFHQVGRLPPVYLEPSVYLQSSQSEENMEVDDHENDSKVSWLPLEQWTLHLVLNLHLPAALQRLLLRNLSFCDDSKVQILSRYWKELPFQRLVLLDTSLSMSKFKEILQSLISDSKVDDIRVAMEKKFRMEELSESLENTVKQERLERPEREKRRQNKPDGKEVVITSDVRLCRECHLFSCTCVQPSINRMGDTYQDFVALVNDIYSYKILSISYSSKDIIVRKDLCEDLHVQCPLAFLNDEKMQRLEWVPGHTDHQELQELSQVLGALALAQAVTLNHTCLSHEGALCLLHHLKKKKQQSGRIEPFRMTIFSRYYHHRPKSVDEVRNSPFTKEVHGDACLQQFNFRCDCSERCHNFKKSIKGVIYFNGELFDDT